jgi:hypothetical protein
VPYFEKILSGLQLQYEFKIIEHINIEFFTMLVASGTFTSVSILQQYAPLSRSMLDSLFSDFQQIERKKL